MSFWIWIAALLLIGLITGCLYRNRHLQQRVAKQQHALQAAHARIHHLEQAQQAKEADRQSTEEKLRSYLQLMDTLLNTIPTPIYFKDEQGVFQGCNKVFAKRILGLTRDRIIGQRPQAMPAHIPADLAATYQREEYKMVAKDSFHTFEAMVQCADGVRREFLFSLAPVRDQKGELSGSVAVLSDLTDKNRVIQERMQKEKLQGVLETAGAVCHELNQPLQALSGYVELLSAKISTDNKMQPYFQKIVVQIDRMRAITDQLQGITRYETMVYADKTQIINIQKAAQLT